MNSSDLRDLCLFEAKLFAILWLPQRFYDRLLEADRDGMSSSGDLAYRLRSVRFSDFTASYRNAAHLVLAGWLEGLR